MHLLRWTFKLFVATGYFLSPKVKSPTKRFLYNVYTAVMTLFLLSFLLTLIMQIVFNVKTADELSKNFGITITVFTTICKFINLLFRRGIIISLLDLLQKEPFLPMNIEEIKIHTKYNKLIEKVSIFYTLQNISCLVALIGATLITDFKKKKLTFEAWIPFNYTASWFLFSLTFIHQCACAMVTSFGISIFDTLFAGLLLQICCQLDTLVHRLQNIKEDAIRSLKYCARQHELIYRFTELMNKLFSSILCLQFLISAVAICFSVYRVIYTKTDSQFAGAIIFVFSALIQIFYFCWHGDIAKYKVRNYDLSSFLLQKRYFNHFFLSTQSLEIPDMIFNSNWPNLSNDAKKILLIIMARSLTPVEIVSAHIIPLNLESFKGLIKATYSAYNMLQQTK
ncbi:odorant receptor 2a-like [Apis laboriosa]|uniref:odorant receptor 2a-like n=1 Tax=Apis laboriosa TaxID=183418 RepID=UPI001CC53E0F|nr:odorant receptor 2a-like [Apis laboriosa]